MSVRDDRRYYLTPYLNTVEKKNNFLLDFDGFIPLDSGVYSKSMGKRKRKENVLEWKIEQNNTIFIVQELKSVKTGFLIKHQVEIKSNE